MGKSMSATLLRQRGVNVVDTDDLARQVVEPGQPALAGVREVFGPDVVGPDGRLRRQELARRVFGNPEARRQLEEILHPPIRALWKAQLEAWRSAGSKTGVVVIPLLFETGAEREFDAIICVACSAGTQKVRLAQRGWSETEVARRLASQLPIEAKMTRSHHVIWSEGSIPVHADQLDRILGCCL